MEDPEVAMASQASNAAPWSILIIDDDDGVRSSLCAVLETSGYNVATAASGEEGISLLTRSAFDIVLCDYRLPGASGLEVLRSTGGTVPFILMTAFGAADLAMEAFKGGVFDYISKPISPDKLLFTLTKFTEFEGLRRENAALRASLSDKYSFNNIIAQSSSFRGVFDTVKRLAPYNTTVLITGESGTGKELIARAIHESSSRRGRPFVAINCGAIPENLMESELFGHKKGAFTDASRDKRGLFEEASGGTLFLDEVGELPLHLQVKLLRALQEHAIRRVGDEELLPVDVRILSATLRDLDADTKSGRFREDLYYRLNVVGIHLLPLRERTEDIPVLAHHFLEKHAKRLGLEIKSIPQTVMQMLIEYPWPGNARELENSLERALVLSVGEELERDSLPERILSFHDQKARGGQQPAGDAAQDDDGNLSIKQRTKTLEIGLITRALQQTKGNRTHAAKILEISHRALLYKLKEYGLG
jgi:two-component system response regulator AtoC